MEIATWFLSLTPRKQSLCAETKNQTSRVWPAPLSWSNGRLEHNHSNSCGVSLAVALRVTVLITVDAQFRLFLLGPLDPTNTQEYRNMTFLCFVFGTLAAWLRKNDIKMTSEWGHTLKLLAQQAKKSFEHIYHTTYILPINLIVPRQVHSCNVVPSANVPFGSHAASSIPF